MNTQRSGLWCGTVRASLALTLTLTAAGTPAQTLRVTAANPSPPDALYDVLFSPPGTTLLDSDGSSYQSFRSLVFAPNSATGGIDVVAADTAGGRIVRYAGPTGTPPVAATVVWSAASKIPGPQTPDGLSIDSAGNLYVISTVGGPNGQVWVLPAAPITSTAPTGFGAPVLLDQNFNGQEIDSLVETVIVPPATAATQGAYASAGIGAGDLLVLRADNDFYSDDGGRYDSKEPALVYRYPAAGISQVIHGTASSVSPTILLWELDFPYPSGAQPTGMDFWPNDGSLLISTSLGTILDFPLPATATNTLPSGWTQSSTTFASISCGESACPFYKLRTGTQAGDSYAFVTQSTGTTSGGILDFSAPTSSATPAWGFDFTAPAAAVATSGATAGSPQGLAVGPPTVAVASSSACTSSAGCNPTGGLANAILPGASPGVSGNVLEQTCIITDTRLQANGTCPGRLNIAQLCPGFAANTIPPSICGASGAAGNQFAVIETTANGVDDVPGILVQTQETPSALIPNTTSPLCTEQVLGWTTRAGSSEGVEPEGTDLIDMLSYCDAAGGVTKGNSMWLVGGQLSPAVSATKFELAQYAQDKLWYLGETVASANIDKKAKAPLEICLIATASLLDTGHFQCAARAVYDCDQLVQSSAAGYGSSPTNPNPYGDVRGRLGSLYFTINSRLLRNTPNTLWPLPPGETPPQCELH